MLALFCWSVAVAQILFFKSADTSKTLQKEQRYAIIAVAYLWFWGDSMERILHNTRKRIVAICFSAFNTIMLLSHFGPLLVVLFQNFEHTAAYLPIYLMPLITPILALVFFLTPKKEYRLKRWLLPLAFGIEVFLMLALKPAGLDVLWTILIPAVISLFACVAALSANLLLPRFDWDNEVTIVKQSASAALGGFAGVLAAAVGGIATGVIPGQISRAVFCLVTIGVTAVHGSQIAVT